MGIQQKELVAVVIDRLPDICDSTQIANVLGVHRRTIARWVKKGLLRGTRTASRGGRLLIARQALIDRLNQLGQQAKPVDQTVRTAEHLSGGER